MYYSVCAPALFMGTPLDEAIYSIAKTGAKAYEFWAWGNNDIEKVYSAQLETGLRCSAMCTSFEPLNVPERHEAYMEEGKRLIRTAQKLGISTMITQVGKDINGVSHEAQKEAIIKGLRKCAALYEDSGIVLTVEPLNTSVDHPGYFLTSSREGYEIVRGVGSPNVRLLFDIYHQQVTEGNILDNLLPNLSLTGHIHVAGNPGRHEPFENSELDYAVVIRKLKEAGYNGAIGLEYLPLREPSESLKRLFEVFPALD